MRQSRKPPVEQSNTQVRALNVIGANQIAFRLPNVDGSCDPFASFGNRIAAFVPKRAKTPIIVNLGLLDKVHVRAKCIINRSQRRDSLTQTGQELRC